MRTMWQAASREGRRRAPCKTHAPRPEGTEGSDTHEDARWAASERATLPPHKTAPAVPTPRRPRVGLLRRSAVCPRWRLVYASDAESLLPRWFCAADRACGWPSRNTPSLTKMCESSDLLLLVVSRHQFQLAVAFTLDLSMYKI
jgi:hypothetical protein